MGFVGLTLAVFFASKNNVVYGIEKDPKRLNSLKNGSPDFFEPKLKNLVLKNLESENLMFSKNIEDFIEIVNYIFITVGTPTKNGKIDLKFIKKIITDIAKLLCTSKNCPVIVIKSTIAPKTTNEIILPILEKISGRKIGKDLFLSTNPEFLREGTAIDDQFNPHVLVIGTCDDRSKQKMKNFFKSLYSQTIPRFFTNFATSELIKYSNNAFLATKISFINSIANLCQKIPGSSVDDVAKIIGLDPRIGPLFLKAGPGYGGSCLPKDLSSLITVFDNHGLDSKFFKSIENVNTHQVDEIINIFKDNLGNFTKKTITILGLSFKENSDDIRESRSIILIKKLKNKCQIKVHDPMAIEKTRKLFGDKIEYFSDVTESLKNSDCAIIMTPWNQYVNLKDFTMMKNPIIIDTRRILKNTKKIKYIPYGKSKN